MSVFVGTADRINLAHLDLTGNTFTIDFGTITRTMAPCTTFADGGYMCVKPALISGEASIDFYQDWAADVIDDEISVGQLGTQYPLTVIPNPTGTVTAGDTCYFSRGILGSLNPLDGLKGEMAKGHFGLPYDTVIAKGLVAHPSAARTTDGNGTAVALTGPTASQKLYAALHVTAYSGFTNVVFKIQSDDASGMSSATDRITFATVTGTTSEFASVAGSFSGETHHRITWDVTGSGSVTFVAAFAVI